MNLVCDVTVGSSWKILHGDCLEILPTLAADSIDAVVTDPPYGLSFMGKAWDYDVPQVEVWREVLRVLKPGGHLLSFFGTRTYHRGVVQIEDAGFEIRDSLIWMYGTGFPKSLNVGKAIDDAAGAERKVVGTRYTAKGNGGTGDDMLAKVSRRNVVDVTAPATPEAARWEGFGTALKPAHEPIVLARKPLTGTVAANVLEHGTGALNIDGCRIEGAPRTTHARGNVKGSNAGQIHNYGLGEGYESAGHEGRWPANVCLDEESARLLDEMSGELHARGNRTAKTFVDPPQSIALGKFRASFESGHAGDSGGASRFFYTAKAPREERDAGLELLDPSSGGEATGRKDGSAGLKSPRAGAGRNGGARNTHPTVKPVDLMRWLVRLVTPPGGIVLDPFAGSASTGVACLHEGLRFLGIERDAEYFRMAKERLSAWAEVKAQLTTIKARASGQLPLFARAVP